MGYIELPAAQFEQEKTLVERHVFNRLDNCDSGEIEWDKLYGSTTTALRNRPERYRQIMDALQTDGKINIYRIGHKRMVSIRQNFTAWRSNC